MTIRLPTGGPKAKAGSLAKREFVPRGYMSLRDAVAEVGKHLFGDDWTGNEQSSNVLLVDTGRHRGRVAAVRERRLALFREQTGRDWQDGMLDGDLPQLSEDDWAEIEKVLGKKWGSKEEARKRSDEATAWLQQHLYGTPPDHGDALPSYVHSGSGKLRRMPVEIWGSRGARRAFLAGQVEYHPGKYGEEWSPTAAPLKGRVLIKREHMVRALSGEDTPPHETPERSAAGEVAVKPRKKGGRPEKYDWDEFWIEVARIANLPDGLPERQGELVRRMLDWCGRTWEEIPGETTVKDRIRRLYTQAIPKRTET